MVSKDEAQEAFGRVPGSPVVKASNAGVWVQALVELTSHMLLGQAAQKKKQYCNKFNKSFKMVHIKKVLKKERKESFGKLRFLLQAADPWAPPHAFRPSGIVSSCAVGESTQSSLCWTEDTPHQRWRG